MLRLYLKDIKVIFSDKKALLIFVLMPMILTTILSFALRGAFSQETTSDLVKIAVVKGYDKEAELQKLKSKFEALGLGNAADSMLMGLDIEKMFFEEFLGNEGIERIFDLSFMSESEADKALSSKKVGVVVTLPNDFLYHQYLNFLFAENHKIQVDLKQHPEFNFSGGIAKSIFESYFNRLNTLWINKSVYAEMAEGVLSPEDLQMRLSEIYAMTDKELQEVTQVQPVKIETRRFISSSSYYAVAMMAMFILYASSNVGREMLSEKHMRTLDRTYVAGVGYGKMLLSKGAMTVTLSGFQMAVLMLYSKFALGVQWERFDQILVAILASAIAVAGLGIFLSTITLVNEDYKVANVFENVIIHLMALVGGSYIPIETMPEFMTHLKAFALNGIVLDMFLDIYQGTSWETLMLPFIKLLCIGLVFTLLAWILVLRKEKSDYVGDAEA